MSSILYKEKQMYNFIQAPSYFNNISLMFPCIVNISANNYVQLLIILKIKCFHCMVKKKKLPFQYKYVIYYK